MVHEVYYDITHGPSLEKLVTAWRWRNEGVVKQNHQNPEMRDSGVECATFQITDGVGSIPIHCLVHGLIWAEGGCRNEVDIEISFDMALVRWTGVYDTRTHQGHITSPQGRQPVQSLPGLGPDVCKVLAPIGITTIADLAIVNHEFLLDGLIQNCPTPRGELPFGTMFYALLREGLKSGGTRFRHQLTDQEVIACLVSLLAQKGLPG